MGNAGEQLVRSCVKTLNRNIRKEVEVKVAVTYNTTEAFLQIQKFRLSHYKLQRCELFNGSIKHPLQQCRT